MKRTPESMITAQTTETNQTIYVLGTHKDPLTQRESRVRVGFTLITLTEKADPAQHPRFKVEIEKPCLQSEGLRSRSDWEFVRYAGTKLSPDDVLKLSLRYKILLRKFKKAKLKPVLGDEERDALAEAISSALEGYIPLHTRWIDPYRPHVPYASIVPCDAGRALVLSEVMTNARQWFKISELIYTADNGGHINV